MSLPPLSLGRSLVKRNQDRLPRKPNRTTSSGAILRSHGCAFPSVEFLREGFARVCHDEGETFDRHAPLLNAQGGKLAWLARHGFAFEPDHLEALRDACAAHPAILAGRIDEFVDAHFRRISDEMISDLPEILGPHSLLQERQLLVRFWSSLLVDGSSKFDSTVLPHVQKMIWESRTFVRQTESGNRPDHGWLTHLSRRLKDFANHPELVAVLDSFAAIAPLSASAEMTVRLTVGKAAPRSLVPGDLVQTALISALHIVRQPDGFSVCEVSSASINCHENDPAQFLFEFREVLSAGTVPFAGEHVEFNDTVRVPVAFKTVVVFSPSPPDLWGARHGSISEVFDHLGVPPDPHLRLELRKKALKLVPGRQLDKNGDSCPAGTIHQFARMLPVAMQDMTALDVQKLQMLDSASTQIEALNVDLQRTRASDKARKLSLQIRELSEKKTKRAEQFERAGIDWRERWMDIQTKQQLVDRVLAAQETPPGLFGWSLTTGTQAESDHKKPRWSQMGRACMEKLVSSNPAVVPAAMKILEVARALYMERVSFRKDAADESADGNPRDSSVMFIRTSPTAQQGVKVHNGLIFGQVMSNLFAEAAAQAIRDASGDRVQIERAAAFLVPYVASQEFSQSVKKRIKGRRNSLDPWREKANNHSGFDDGVSQGTSGLRQPRYRTVREFIGHARGPLAPGELLKQTILQNQRLRARRADQTGIARKAVATGSHSFNLLLGHPSTAGSARLPQAALDDWITHEFVSPAKKAMALSRNFPSLRELVRKIAAEIPFSDEQRHAFTQGVYLNAAIPGGNGEYTLKRLARAINAELQGSGLRRSQRSAARDLIRASLSGFDAFEPHLAVVADPNYGTELVAVGYDILSERKRLFSIVESYDPLAQRARQKILRISEFENANWEWVDATDQ